jgi:methyl coenzyme M reductase beta subunit
LSRRELSLSPFLARVVQLLFVGQPREQPDRSEMKRQMQSFRTHRRSEEAAMFRRIILAIAFVAVLGTVGLAMPNTAEAWRYYYNDVPQYYYGVPSTPYGHATANGYTYPGAPYYQRSGPPY